MLKCDAFSLAEKKQVTTDTLCLFSHVLRFSFMSFWFNKGLLNMWNIGFNLKVAAVWVYFCDTNWLSLFWGVNLHRFP